MVSLGTFNYFAHIIPRGNRGNRGQPTSTTVPAEGANLTPTVQPQSSVTPLDSNLTSSDLQLMQTLNSFDK